MIPQSPPGASRAEWAEWQTLAMIVDNSLPRDYQTIDPALWHDPGAAAVLSAIQRMADRGEPLRIDRPIRDEMTRLSVEIGGSSPGWALRLARAIAMPEGVPHGT